MHGRAPGGPEIDQDVLSLERFQPDGLAGEVLGLEARSRLADPIQPSQLPGDLVTQAGAVGKPFLECLVDLSSDRELTSRDGRGGERLGEAGREVFLIALTQAVHQLLVPCQGLVVAAGLGPGHRGDDLRQRLDRPVGIVLEVAQGRLLIVGEPVVLDGLVEEGRKALITVVGLGILLQVGTQLPDQGTIMLAEDLGDARSGRLLGRRGSGEHDDQTRNHPERLGTHGILPSMPRACASGRYGVDGLIRRSQWTVRVTNGRPSITALPDGASRPGPWRLPARVPGWKPPRRWAARWCCESLRATGSSTDSARAWRGSSGVLSGPSGVPAWVGGQGGQGGDEASASPSAIVKPQPAWRIVSADSQWAGPTKSAGRPEAMMP